MPSIFLCYRRENTQDAAGRLHDRLVDAYGPERVFMDIDSVPLGIDFVEHVTEQIGKCSAVIVMIGKQWHTIKDKKRRRRLDNEDDLVRAEIRAALQQKIPVIPVNVQNAAIPQAEDLPDNIRLLARRNGIAFRHDQWREAGRALLKELNPVMGRRAEVLAAAIMESSSGAVLYPFSQKVIPPHTKHTTPASHCDDTSGTRVACWPVVTSAGALLSWPISCYEPSMPYVLVVDDDGAVRRMIVLLLRSTGYATETANDGAEALALMQQQRPCLVLLDISMPVMDGWEFRKHQLEDPALADVPVICMTGMVHPEDIERTLGIPCLGKPVDFPSLIRLVEKSCRPPAS